MSSLLSACRGCPAFIGCDTSQGPRESELLSPIGSLETLGFGCTAAPEGAGWVGLSGGVSC